MMKFFNILFACSLFIWGCNNTNSKKSGTPSESIVPKEHEHSSEDRIELNSGKKWKVDDAMLIHIRNMENDLQHFIHSEQNNYVELANKLQSNIDLLTSNCTMEGQAHDELHKWLLPYIDMVEEFSKSSNMQESTRSVEKIIFSFTTFNTYFE